jgi:glutamate-5-semialdehyde dehydrogenase
MLHTEPLSALRAGMQIIVSGNRVLTVPAELAERFRPGDSIAYVEELGELLLLPAAERRAAANAVEAAAAAFGAMSLVRDEQIDEFYEAFALRLESETVWARIAEINVDDVEDARRRKRSTTRLSTTRSGRARRALCSALSPSAATLTEKPAACR